MIEFSVRGILLDIEGTVSSLHYVHEVLFPFARKHLANFLKQHWQAEELQPVLEQIAIDAGSDTFSNWAAADQAAALQRTLDQLNAWMDADAKLTGLKSLQGMIWREGFESGELRSRLFADVPEALAAWTAEGTDVRIFSSGSVAAQSLIFAHTTTGNLSGLLKGHYDTTTGPKRSAESYQQIAADFALPTGEILFASDIVEELDAARQAGMQTLLLLRPGNGPIHSANGHAAAESFSEIRCTPAATCVKSAG